MSVPESYYIWQYELTVVHPAVHKWLLDHGYQVRHEVNIPNAGRIDFVAIKDNNVLLVECKQDCSSFSRTIAQVLDYEKQFDQDAFVAIAVPHHSITATAKTMCAQRNIQLILVEVPKQPPPPKDENTQFLVDLAIYKRRCFTSPTLIIQEIKGAGGNDLFELTRARTYAESFATPIDPFTEMISRTISMGHGILDIESHLKHALSLYDEAIDEVFQAR
jgi:hypothetical protein